MNVRLAEIRGRAYFVWLDSHGEGLPIPDTSRAWRRAIYRAPLSSADASSSPFASSAPHRRPARSMPLLEVSMSSRKSGPTRGRTELRSWPMGEHVATTVHRIVGDGEESIELSGVHPRMDLRLDDETRGHEMVLAERARADHR